jgi:hypothetical protein
VGRGWTLIAADGDPLESLDEERRAVLHALDVTVASLDPLAPAAVADVDGRLTAWLARDGTHAVLTRPDFYVFGSVASADALPALVDNLRAELALEANPLPRGA